MTAREEWKKTKTIYYKDELNDDFDDVGVRKYVIPKNYQYIRKNPFKIAWGGFLYYCIGKPILALYCFFHGVRVKNRRNLKRLRGKGYFIYANHVAIADVVKYMAIVVNRRLETVAYANALSIPVAKHIIKSCGFTPLPSEDDQVNWMKFHEDMKFYIEHKHAILIFPEAHIWPYYTKIRPFVNSSFYYPAVNNAPIVPMVTVWRGKKGSKRPPKQTIVIGKPIFPDPELSLNENKQYLRDACYEQMVRIAEKYDQPEYIKYIKVEE